MGNRAAVAVLLLVFASPLPAEEPGWTTGQKLLQQCAVVERSMAGQYAADQQGFYNHALCLGYVNAVFDVFVNVPGSGVCTPEAGLTSGQLALVLLNYLRAHPETLQEVGARIFGAAMSEAFPCNTIQLERLAGGE